MIIPVKDVGKIGVIKDLSSSELPINAWTDASNIRFLDGLVHQVYGYSAVYGTPSVTPYHVFPLDIAGAKYWIYCSLAKIYALTITAGAAVNTNITRQTAGVDVDYAATQNSWTSTVIGGIPIINAGNTTDVPQYWDTNTANNCAALTNFPASTYCKAMRSYKGYLIALGVTKGSTSYPYMVKWSNPAEPGALPTSWDATDPSNDAGESDLAEGDDIIVDGGQLRDTFIIYKENSAFRMDFTGGQWIFNFNKIGDFGAMARNCWVEVDGMHVVLTKNDIIATDGVNFNSILDKQARRWLFLNMDNDNRGNCFVFKNPYFNEVYIAYPNVGSTIPDRAVVWNYKDKTVGFRTLPNIYCANYGQVDNTLANSWQADGDSWESDLTLWGSGDYVPGNSRVIMGNSTPLFYMLDGSATENGTNVSSYLERIGISFDDHDSIKLVKGIRPRITGTPGGTVIAKVGYADTPYDTPTYTSMTYTIGTTLKCDCMVSGRYIAVYFGSGTATQWRLDSYGIEVEQAGMY